MFFISYLPFFLLSLINFTEMWQVDEVTPAADWWSVGALLYEIIIGQVWANERQSSCDLIQVNI